MFIFLEPMCVLKLGESKTTFCFGILKFEIQKPASKVPDPRKYPLYYILFKIYTIKLNNFFFLIFHGTYCKFLLSHSRHLVGENLG